MPRSAVRLALLFGLAPLLALPATAAHAAIKAEKDRPVARLDLGDDDEPLGLTVVRSVDKEGGLTLKLVVRGGGKPQSLVVYTGGGEDDGPGQEHLKKVSLTPIDLGGGQQGARVDFTYRMPEGKKNDEATDTTLIGFAGGKPKRLIELRTRRARDRGKLCREAEETELAIQGDGAARVLVATTRMTVDPVLGDDDLPIDKKCRAPAGAQKKIYKWSDGQFVDPDRAATEDDDDDDDE